MDVTVIIRDTKGNVTFDVMDEYDDVSEHFKVWEFLVNKKDAIDLAIIDMYTVKVLEGLRIMTDCPIEITSTGRTPKYNLAEKGSIDSIHRFFIGVIDFIVHGAFNVGLQKRIKAYTVAMGFTGIGVYDNAKGMQMHIDRGYRDNLTEW